MNGKKLFPEDAISIGNQELNELGRILILFPSVFPSVR